jgi:AcrR family transcriptional regulator
MRPAKHSVVNKLATVTTATAIFASVRAGAKPVFSQGGSEASLEAVARRAGLGIETLYRHFPTRETLYEAVHRHEVEQLVELARHLEAETPHGRGAAPLVAGRRGIHGDKEGHSGGARYGCARFPGPRGLFA